jgi:hypothetical protein
MFDAMTLDERVAALAADIPADTPKTTLDKAAGLERGTISKIAAGGWGKAANVGGSILAKLADLFDAHAYLLGKGRKPAREDVRAAVERALRRAGLGGRHSSKVRAANPASTLRKRAIADVQRSSRSRGGRSADRA